MSDRSVIVDPAFLGDVVFDGPLVRALKAEAREGWVGLVVRPSAEAIARRIVGVDRIHVFDKRGVDRGLKGLRRLARELSEEGYDRAFVPHPSIRSLLLVRLARIPDRRGISFPWLGRAGYTRVTRRGGDESFVSMRLRLLGDDDTELEPSLAGALFRPASAEVDVETRIRVGLVLGSNWATKRWPPEEAAVLVRGLVDRGFLVSMIGSEAERPLFDPVRRLDGVEPSSLDDRIGGSVDDLLRNIARCQILIAGDTGPLHVARAFGLPVVALFGPTSEKCHRFEAGDQVLFTGIDCRPCSEHGHDRCPLGHHRCLREIEASKVLTAVERIAIGLEEGRRIEKARGGEP